VFITFQKGSLGKFNRIGLTLAIGIYLFFTVAFLHVHVSATGELITHSHPFSSTSENTDNKTTHSHSNLEFLHFNLISLLITFCLLLLLLYFILPEKRLPAKIKLFNPPQSKLFIAISNRAPPQH
jgi:hypothetical protein